MRPAGGILKPVETAGPPPEPKRRPRLRIWLSKEPLVHFLVAGLALFLLHGLIAPDDDEATRRIVVDRERLLNYMQYRAKVFEPVGFGRALDALPKPELDELVADYAREEALYREAKAMGLDRNDDVARRRLIQQLEFVARGVAAAEANPTEAELRAFYAARQGAYRVPAKVTFTHVFFNGERPGAEARARSKLAELNRTRTPFHAAVAHGERFLYHLNYVEKEAEEVASHFGPAMRAEVFAFEPDSHTWRGPFRSPYGFHLVLLTQRTASHVPPFEDVRSQVEQDARQAAEAADYEKSIGAIVAGYDVEVVGALRRTGSGAP
ncbi:peptidylprolyl isomerase [Phenylobacterium sp.]|uniref:peptidylprolyl isomerase n=1 Tax=Phenylobacterium sp. TaxID=1871053 RepID=UPI00273702B8|nr:peptidylprolyl isomerase [Phenylobacterium sp.]